MKSGSRWPVTLLVLVALLVAGPAVAAFQLVLKDGRTLTGADMKRVNGNYVLIQAGGERLTLAANQVAEVRIVGDDILQRETAAAEPAQGEDGAEAEEEPAGIQLAGGSVSDRLIRSDPATVGGAEAPDMPQPPGHARPEDMPGNPDRPLQPGEWRPEGDWGQTDDGWLKDGWVTETPDNTWTPESDYATDLEDNNWNPSTWTKPAIDPSWTPKDAYGRGTSSDSTWTPTDGFNRTNSSMRVVLPPTAAATPGTAGSAPAAEGGASGDGFTAMVGPASWYGEAFRGRTTASGKPFDPDGLTAAHDTLPFGTLVMVTRQDDTGRSVVVEITDRGAGNRVVNLSQGAAAALDMLDSGVVEVRIEPLPDQSKPVVPPAAAETAGAVDAGDADEEQVPAVPAGSEEPAAPAGASQGGGGDEERR